jgi:Cu2+-containing amine oxidase
MTLNLNQKIVAIMKSAQAIGKNGYNDRHEYKYIKAVDVIREVRSLLVDQGLRLKSEVSSIDRQPCGKMTLATITIKYTLIDAETGETETTHMIAEGADTGDKAINKAMTSGLKYFFRDTFMLDFADDAEATQAAPAPQTQLKAATFDYDQGESPTTPLTKNELQKALTVLKGEHPKQQQRMTKEQLSATLLQSTEPLSETERKKLMRQFFAECKNRNISDKWSKVIVVFYTQKDSRKDVTCSEWRDIIQVLPTITKEEMKEMAFSVKERQELEAV